MHDTTFAYARHKWAESLSQGKQAAAMDPRLMGALLGGGAGLLTASMSGRRDEHGRKDRPWLRNLLLGSLLGTGAGAWVHGNPGLMHGAQRSFENAGNSLQELAYQGRDKLKEFWNQPSQ